MKENYFQRFRSNVPNGRTNHETINRRSIRINQLDLEGEARKQSSKTSRDRS